MDVASDTRVGGNGLRKPSVIAWLRLARVYHKQDGQTRPRGRVLLVQPAKPLRAFMATEAGSAGLLLTVTVVALTATSSARYAGARRV